MSKKADGRFAISIQGGNIISSSDLAASKVHISDLSANTQLAIRLTPKLPEVLIQNFDHFDHTEISDLDAWKDRNVVLVPFDKK